MKKICYLAAAGMAFLVAACNGPVKTGNSQADSGSHGSSGAAPAVQTGTSTGSSAQSSGTSDTSKKTMYLWLIPLNKKSTINRCGFILAII